LLALCALTLCTTAPAAQEAYIVGTDAAGVSRPLLLNRTPALYTGDFGDCLGGQSLFNITKFDAAYYADNMTVLFHIDGNTNIKNESLMMYISVNAYAEERFAMTINPCFLNIYSLCPLLANTSIAGWATIPVGPLQVAGILPIALTLPDLEGYARLQIFANSSQTEIGCFQAIMTNGNTFAQSNVLSPVFAFFTAIAVFFSFATAMYGVSVQHMRTHFAHSLSVFIVFETYQSFFLTGAMNLAWPSMLPSWWSNFAWACGLINAPSVIGGINNFVGVRGNGSQVGGASSATIDTGGGLAAQIYSRDLQPYFPAQPRQPYLYNRNTYNSSNPYDYTWAGDPVKPGLPLPGSWDGFPSNLANVGIPIQAAFLSSLIWFVVAMAGLVVSLLLWKGLLELLAGRKWIKEDRLAYFRTHYIAYIRSAVLRFMLIGFFTLTTLALVQVTLKGSPTGPTAIAAVALIILVIGFGSILGYAAYSRLKFGRYVTEQDRIIVTKRKALKFLPIFGVTRTSTIRKRELAVTQVLSIPFFRIKFIDRDPERVSTHQDVAWIHRFGWLTARYRRTMWWFFSFYFCYLFIKALFIGAAGSNPKVQAIGVFVAEMIAFAIIIQWNPYEGSRNTAMAVWMLGISKIVTAGLSIAFIPSLGLDRIIATVLGVIVIVVQGFCVVGLAILICLGAISSYMSLTRNHEQFWPEGLEPFRVQFFEKMQARAPDRFIPPKPKEDKKGKKKLSEESTPSEPKEPYFSVNTVRRAPKIEDEDGDVVAEMLDGPNNSSMMALHSRGSMLGLEGEHGGHARNSSLRMSRTSRPNSISSRYSVGSLPSRARPHRASWSSQDFATWEGHLDRPNSALAHRLSSSSMNVLAAAGAAGSSSTSLGGRQSAKVPAPIAIPEGGTETKAEKEGVASGSASPTGVPLPSSPVSAMNPNRKSTPSRDTLARYAEERMSQHPPTPVEEDEEDGKGELRAG
jgi:hypothetical protein